MKHINTGAQIIEVKINNHDLLYVSPLCDLNKKKSIRGGIPIIFPQFGENGYYKKHGFARDIDWKLINETKDSTNYIVEYECDISKNTHELWTNNTKLNLIAASSNNMLEIKFIVKNQGKDPICFTGGLHPYFKITSRSQIRIEGLESSLYIDSYPELQEVFHINSNTLIERLYLCNKNIIFYNGSLNMKLQMNGFDNWMIWNPGIEYAKLIDDLPSEDWDKFICIEPVIKDNPIQLLPNDEFIGELKIEINS